MVHEPTASDATSPPSSHAPSAMAVQRKVRTAPRTGGHLAFLDGVRGIAALYVVFHHIWLTTYPAFPADTGPRWASWMLWGHLAVAVFIVVSGFSLALAPLRHGDRLARGFPNYIQRRAFRILPPYWVALLISVATIAAFTGQFTGRGVSPEDIAVHALLLQDVVGSQSPNGAFWSIAIEWQIYFLFPLILLLWRRTGGPATMSLVAGAVVASHLLGTHVAGLSKLLDLTPQFLALFAFGVAGAHVLVAGGRWSRVNWIRVGLGLLVLTVVLLTIYPPASVEAQFFWVDLLAGAAAAALFAGMAQRPAGKASAALGGSAFRWLGQSSYSLYLIHLPVLGLVYWGVVVKLTDPNDMRFVLLLVIGLPTAVVASRGFWWLFERPFMEHRSVKGLKGAWSRSRPARQVEPQT